VVERHPQEATKLRPLGMTGRLRWREFPPRSIGIFQRNLGPEARGCLYRDGTRLIRASGLAEQACGALADEHPSIAERPRSELLPEVQLALAPGKPQSARHAVEVLTDGRKVAALADFIRQKR